MALKKYTLYFKGKNKYGHEHNLPIVTLDLKSMDEYTCNYKSYNDLFNYLPVEVKEFIKENLSFNLNFESNNLKDNIFITDNDFNPIMDIIFESDEDILYIKPLELCDMILKEKMTFLEYQTVLLNINSLKKIEKKYEFFKYLYDTYVKNEKIACMIDVYDTSKIFTNLSSDELMIAALATDKDNIIVLCKKLGQNLESRRNLALKFKKLFSFINKENKIIDNDSIMLRKNEDLLFDEIGKQMLSNLGKFKENYEKEYLKSIR